MPGGKTILFYDSGSQRPQIDSETARAAALKICALAKDLEDAKRLMHILGLLDEGVE